MRRPRFLFLLILFAPGIVRGQSTAATDQAEQIKALLARVELLEKEVATLKSNQLEAMNASPPSPVMEVGPPPSAAPPRPSPAAPSSSSMFQGHEHESQVAQEAMREIETHYPSLQFHGFGDVDFFTTDQKAPPATAVSISANSTFTLPRLSPRKSATSPNSL